MNLPFYWWGTYSRTSAVQHILGDLCMRTDAVTYIVWLNWLSWTRSLCRRHWKKPWILTTDKAFYLWLSTNLATPGLPHESAARKSTKVLRSQCWFHRAYSLRLSLFKRTKMLLDHILAWTIKILDKPSAVPHWGNLVFTPRLHTEKIAYYLKNWIQIRRGVVLRLKSLANLQVP